MIILKVTKKQGFNLSSEDTFLKKNTKGGRRGIKLNPLAPAAALGSKIIVYICMTF